MRSCNHCCSGKATSITYLYWIFVALCIKHAMSMRHFVICDMAGSTIFVHIILQTAGFSIKKSHWTYNVLWCSLQTLSETFLILRRNERDMITSEHGSSCKVAYSIFLSDFQETWFLYIFSKNNQKSNFIKIYQWEPSCCMRTTLRKAPKYGGAISGIDCTWWDAYTVPEYFD